MASDATEGSHMAQGKLRHDLRSAVFTPQQAMEKESGSVLGDGLMGGDFYGLKATPPHYANSFGISSP
jgi:hypothetical protein